MKQQFMHDETVEIEQARDFELENISKLIREVEVELKNRLEKTGLPSIKPERSGNPK